MRHWQYRLLALAATVLLVVASGVAQAMLSMEQVWEYSSPTDLIDLAISGDGRIVGFTTEADIHTGRESTGYVFVNGKLSRHYQTGGRLWGTQVSNDGSLVAISSAGDETSTLSLLQTSSGQVLWKRPYSGYGYILGQGDLIVVPGVMEYSEPTRVLDGQGQTVKEIPDSLNVSVAKDGRVFSYQYGEKIVLAEAPHKVIREFPHGTIAALSDSGRLVAVGIQKRGEPQSLQVYESHGRLLWEKAVPNIWRLTMAGNGSAVLAIRESRGKYGATCLDINGKPLWILDLSRGEIVDALISPEGGLFVLAINYPDSNGEVRIYNKTGSIVGSETMPEEIRKVRLTNDGHGLVVASKRHVRYFLLR